MSTRLRTVERLGAAASKKLESSGLTDAQALALGMYEVASAAALHEAFEARPALVIPYYGPDKRPLAAHPTWPQFYRARYLDEPPKKIGAGAKKPQRYTQVPGSGVCAYLPNNADWTAIMADTREAVMITEGELKAAKATAEGFPTIGLGGVFNFRASRQGVFFLPMLEQFAWPMRRVTIAYDSDYASNPMVCSAINAIATELQERGALVELITLPDVYDDGRKTGLDDFLVMRGDDALVELIRNAEPLAMTARLWAMNEELVYVKDPGLIVDQGSNQKIATTAFTAHSQWATSSVPERKVSPKGIVSFEKVAAAPIWLRWPLRTSVRRLTYKPGAPRLVDGDLNEWRGWGVTPVKGDTRPWHALLKYLFDGCDEGFLEWFLDWCAYPLQHPGTKMFSAVVVHGRVQGTGKTLVGYILGKIYGDNFTKIESKHLRRDFNGWAVNRQFVLGDEISGSDKRSESDALKTIITQEEMSVNVKFLPEYSLPDCINYFFTSNHADSFFIEDTDRRYAIAEVLAKAPQPDEFYRSIDKWKDGDGPAALFYELLQRDVSNFNPKAAAFKTSAKARMAMAGKSDLAMWVAELLEFPDVKLRFGQMYHRRDLFTSAELLGMYRLENEQSASKVSANGMARALSAAGFRQASNGNPILLGENQARYFIVRNHAKWLKAKQMDVVKNLKLPPAHI